MKSLALFFVVALAIWVVDAHEKRSLRSSTKEDKEENTEKKEADAADIVEHKGEIFVPCIQSAPGHLVEPCGHVDVVEMRKGNKRFDINVGFTLFSLPATTHVMGQLETLVAAVIILMIIFFIDRSKIYEGANINSVFGAMKELFVGGFPKINDNTSLLSTEELKADDDDKMFGTGGDFIAPANYYRMMAMFIIANPHDLSYIIWAHTILKVLVLLLAQILVPLYELYRLFQDVDSVQVSNIAECSVFRLLCLTTICTWINKVFITKIDDAMSANYYLLDRVYVEPEFADGTPKASRTQCFAGAPQTATKHLWLTISVALKAYQAITLYLLALLNVAMFDSKKGEFTQLVVAIVSVIALLDLDSSLVHTDGHMKERYRVLVRRLQDPEKAPTSGNPSENAALVSEVKASSYYEPFYKAYFLVMKWLVVFVPLFLFCVSFSGQMEPL